LHSGDYFEITFPEGVNDNGVLEGGVELPDGPICAPLENLNDISCSKVRNNTLKAKLTFGSGRISGGRDF
jgi:hypothetical protein